MKKSFFLAVFFNFIINIVYSSETNEDHSQNKNLLNEMTKNFNIIKYLKSLILKKKEDHIENLDPCCNNSLPATYAKLPNEIIAHILSYADILSLINVGMVNHQHYQIIKLIEKSTVQVNYNELKGLTYSYNYHFIYLNVDDTNTFTYKNYFLEKNRVSSCFGIKTREIASLKILTNTNIKREEILRLLQ